MKQFTCSLLFVRVAAFEPNVDAALQAALDLPARLMAGLPGSDGGRRVPVIAGLPDPAILGRAPAQINMRLGWLLAKNEKNRKRDKDYR